jgi:hypothetical protein
MRQRVKDTRGKSTAERETRQARPTDPPPKAPAVDRAAVEGERHATGINENQRWPYDYLTDVRPNFGQVSVAGSLSV